MSPSREAQVYRMPRTELSLWLGSAVDAEDAVESEHGFPAPTPLHFTSPFSSKTRCNLTSFKKKIEFLSICHHSSLQ